MDYCHLNRFSLDCVKRYFCFELVGLSGFDISIYPAEIAGSKIYRLYLYKLLLQFKS